MKHSSSPFEMLRLADLVARSKLSASTIRYYVAQGLLSKAHGTTYGAHYDATHLRELADIRYWKKRGLKLAEIRLAIRSKRVHFTFRQTREGAGKSAELVYLIGEAVEIRCRSTLSKVEQTLAKRVVAWAKRAARSYEEELSAPRSRATKSPL